MHMNQTMNVLVDICLVVHACTLHRLHCSRLLAKVEPADGAGFLAYQYFGGGNLLDNLGDLSTNVIHIQVRVDERCPRTECSNLHCDPISAHPLVLSKLSIFLAL